MLSTGVCNCYPGYVGGECAHRRAELPRPSGTAVVHDGLCEVSASQRCEDIFITGQDFVDSAFFSCHIQSVKVSLPAFFSFFLLLFLHSFFYGDVLMSVCVCCKERVVIVPTLWETNFACDSFEILCHLGSHLPSSWVDLVCAQLPVCKQWCSCQCLGFCVHPC